MSPYITLYLPLYSEVRHSLIAFRGVSQATAFGTVSRIWGLRQASQGTLNWSDPDTWISQLPTEQASLAQRIWEQSGRTVNPYRLEYSYHFINHRALAAPDSTGVFQLTAQGQAFLDDNEQLLGELDKVEGLTALLATLAARTSAQSDELVPDWEKYLHKHSKVKISDSKANLLLRLANLVERKLVLQDGGTYRITPQGIGHLGLPAPEGACMKEQQHNPQIAKTIPKQLEGKPDASTLSLPAERKPRAEKPQQVAVQLPRRGTGEEVSAAKPVQPAGNLDDQIRDCYPFPLAFGYRTLRAIREPAERYKEQLRVAENILAFLGSIGLTLTAYTGALSRSNNSALTDATLTSYWGGGISPGDWQAMGRQAGSILRGDSQLAVVDKFASLWFKGSGGRESEFGARTKKLVEWKNSYKHDRGPTTSQEYAEAAVELESYLRHCFQDLSFLVNSPIRLVQQVDVDWRTARAKLDTLVYMGDHPGLRQEQVILAGAVSKDKLYLQVTNDEWVQLYPIISVQYCPSCKARETYMIDRWEAQRKRVVLKSFERGHTLENDTAGEVGADLEHWLRAHLANQA